MSHAEAMKVLRQNWCEPINQIHPSFHLMITTVNQKHCSTLYWENIPFMQNGIFVLRFFKRLFLHRTRAIPSLEALIDILSDITIKGGGVRFNSLVLHL